MSKRIYITPDTSIDDEVKPILVRKIKEKELLQQVIDTCQNVKNHLRSSSLNSPNFQQHITRTITVGNTTFVVHGSMTKPSILKRIFG